MSDAHTINEKLIRHIAALARLSLTDEEVKEFVPQMQEVFASFEKLQDANVHGVEPSFHPITLKNRTRDDDTHKPLTQEEALSNSPNTTDGYFRAPPSV